MNLMASQEPRHHTGLPLRRILLTTLSAHMRFVAAAFSPTAPHRASSNGRSRPYAVLAKHFPTVQHFSTSKFKPLSGWKLHRWLWDWGVSGKKFTPRGSSSSQVARQLKLSEKGKRAKLLSPWLRSYFKSVLPQMCSPGLPRGRGEQK